MKRAKERWSIAAVTSFCITHVTFDGWAILTPFGPFVGPLLEHGPTPSLNS
jgi:hypothetical protein